MWTLFKCAIGIGLVLLAAQMWPGNYWMLFGVPCASLVVLHAVELKRKQWRRQ